MGNSKIFKCGFDSEDYKDILPDIDVYLENDYLLNADAYKKGNIDDCVWKKYIPTFSEISSPEFRAREIKRILKTGVWICISRELIWLPPSYYFALQYCPAGSADFQFRLKRLKNVYAKIRARKNPGCIGQLIMKSRGDGETTMQMTDGFWECLDGNMNTGQIGVQSKTLSDGKNPCWSYVQNLWQNLPRWIKNDLCSDFASGNNIAEKMQWMREADETKNQRGRNVLFTYYPSGTPMDGKHDMKICFLDEVAKWSECSFYDTYTNYKKFIMPGTERRGLFMMFSTPADVPCKSNEEVYALWKDSDTNEIDEETGTTKSRIHRYYSNPLDGIAGEYDKFGDADPQRIYDHIMRERKNTKKDKLFGEIRGYPLNEAEMFEMTDGGKFWDNHAGIEARKIYLLGTKYKDPKTKEPVVVFGNIDWKDGIKDQTPEFRMSDKTDFDVYDARFCFSYLPQNMPELKRNSDNIVIPPSYVENCVGIDSVDKRYANKRASNFAMVNRKFRDIYETGIVNCFTMAYCNRPLPIEISYEDAIKFCVYNQSLAQVESLNTKIVDYFEDRGYIDWMISKIGMPKNSLMKGDAPHGGGKSAFMDEIIGLLNACTNIPATPDDPNPLDLHWIYCILDDLSRFNRDDTHANDISMAAGQSLLAAVKLLFKKRRETSKVNNAVLNYLLS